MYRDLAGPAGIPGTGDLTGGAGVSIPRRTRSIHSLNVDMMRPHLVPTLRIVSAFVHNGQPADITSVMVDGRWLMRDGKVLTVDEADVVRRAEQVGHSVWRRLLKQYPNVPFPVALPP